MVILILVFHHYWLCFTLALKLLLHQFIQCHTMPAQKRFFETINSHIPPLLSHSTTWMEAGLSWEERREMALECYISGKKLKQKNNKNLNPLQVGVIVDDQPKMPVRIPVNRLIFVCKFLSLRFGWPSIHPTFLFASGCTWYFDVLTSK